MGTDRKNALELINRIATEIEEARPTRQKMIADLKMMNFKIRPLSGDLFSISSNTDLSFIQSLWRIGKIEEVVKTAVEELADDEAEVFFEYLEKFEEELEQTAYMTARDGAGKKGKIVTLEIFRDSEFKKIIRN